VKNWPQRTCQLRRVSGSCSELKNSCQVGRMGPKSSWLWQREEGKACPGEEALVMESS